MSYFVRLVVPYIFLFFSLNIDIWLFFLFDVPVPVILIAYWYAMLYTHQSAISFSITNLIFCAAFSQIVGIPAWWPLLLLAPLGMGLTIITEHFFQHPLYPGLAAALYTILDLALLRPLILGKISAPSYTIWLFFSTLFVTTIFSLKMKTGKTGQSLTRM